MKSIRPTKPMFWMAQILVLVACGWSFARASLQPVQPLVGAFAKNSKNHEIVHVNRTQAPFITSLHDDPELISDEDLHAVLDKVLPRFSQHHIRPNYVEHALRIWEVDCKFRVPAEVVIDPDVPRLMQGSELTEFLTNHARFLASWSTTAEPLLIEEPEGGVAIRWGVDDSVPLEIRNGASVHHDHWLACLTEGGITLDHKVFTPSHSQRNINDALQQSLRDFRLDEREVEWSGLAFAMWLAPEKGWTNKEGREITFDMLCRRLMRGTHWGVCSGTHRVFSLMAILRLDDEHHMLSPAMHAEVYHYLEGVRDQITACQFEDGHWPSNWAEGKAALDKPVEDVLSKKVIATGHHLEWLAIAPIELHPPRDMVRKAARWCIDTTKNMPQEQVSAQYTFFSHIGGALARWRKTRPKAFWMAWEERHSAESGVEAPVPQ